MSSTTFIKWRKTLVKGKKDYQIRMGKRQINCPVSCFYDRTHIERFGYRCPYKHKAYFWPGEISNEFTIISESICKFIYHTNKTLVQAYPGLTLEDLLAKLFKEEIKVTDFKIVIVHVGTNNLVQTSLERFMQLVENITSYIITKNPGVSLAWSGIIPRPCDIRRHLLLEGDVSLEDKRWRFNKELKSFGKTHNILILYSWRAFIDKKSKQVKEELFALDGLHLSRKGTLALKKYFVGSINLMQRNLTQN